MRKPFVTQTMIQHWVGSDHDNKDAMLGLLVELLNGGTPSMRCVPMY